MSGKFNFGNGFICSSTKIKSTYYDKTLCKLAAVDKNIYLLTGDLGFGVLDKFAEKYPDNFINMGSSEQNMNSVAAGMSLEDSCDSKYDSIFTCRYYRN